MRLARSNAHRPPRDRGPSRPGTHGGSLGGGEVARLPRALLNWAGVRAALAEILRWPSGPLRMTGNEQMSQSMTEVGHRHGRARSLLSLGCPT